LLFYINYDLFSSWFFVAKYGFLSDWANMLWLLFFKSNF
jgi:hypothetical protein